ncbi:hypothetical protein MRB53_036933 [Persea americana]|nr:hypothetical protein MRB53_036933 [Persea americana]
MPGCKTCEVYQDCCQYEKPPAMSQIIAMASRLQELEKELARRDRGDSHETMATLPLTPPTSSATPPVCSFGSTANVTALPHQLSLSLEQPSAELSAMRHKVARHHSLVDVELSRLERQYDTVHGHVDQFGASLSPGLAPDGQGGKIFEQIAIGNAAVKLDLPRELMASLLQTHAAWLAPIFLWVYRPAFVRDMAIDGPYCTPFLLLIICGHAASHYHESIADALMSRARTLLGFEMQKPSSIATIQGLLQFSAHEMVAGAVSQAWLYSGMAFRMMTDLGLHQMNEQDDAFANLSLEELEIRKRLFWSCFLWDKFVSSKAPGLALICMQSPELMPGSEAFHHRSARLPYPDTQVVNETSEHDLWTIPETPTSSPNSSPRKSAYEPVSSYPTACFANFCKLGIIINDIIGLLYSRKTMAEANVTEDKFKSLRSRLDAWKLETPSYLSFDARGSDKAAPPPHILTQNVLYQATVILLHRPFYTSEKHHAACRQAADNIEHLLLVFESAFGFSKITYILGYCIYTAASVLVQDVKAGDKAASMGMATFLRALKQALKRCPVLQRSLDSINTGLAGTMAIAASGPSSPMEWHPQSYLPAFPYSSMPNGADVQSYYMETIGADSFPLLDSFPEMRLDQSQTWIWPDT